MGPPARRRAFSSTAAPISTSWVVYNPDGTVLINETGVGTGGNIIDTPVLGSTGTYSLLIKNGIVPLCSLCGTFVEFGQTSVTVTNPPAATDFSLTSLSEYYQNAPLAQTYKIYVSYGASFAQTVTLTAGGLPTGATATFNPASVFGTAISTLTFTVPTSVPLGAYPITVTGTGSGGTTHSITVQLNVDRVPNPPWSEADIQLSTAGAAHYSNGIFTVIGGGGWNLFFTDPVHLVYQTITGDATIVTRVASMYNMPAQYGSGIAWGGVMFREALNETSKTFYLRLNSTAGWELLWRDTTGASLNSVSGSPATAPYWLKVARQGNSFSAFISPDGATWTQVGATMTISMAATLSAGITASAPNFGYNAQVVYDNVTITTMPDFNLTATPATASVIPGNSAVYTVNVGALSGFTGTVNLTASGLPAGATATFTPPSVTGSGTSTLTIATTAATPQGSFVMAISGTSGGLTHATTVTLVTAPDFTISISPTSMGANVSTTVNYTVTAAFLNGFSGPVALTATGVPVSATASFTPASLAAPGNSTFSVTLGRQGRRPHT